MTPAGVAILGATGSIGRSALRVLERHADRFVPRALTAHSNVDALAACAGRFNVPFVGVVDAPPETPGHWRRGAGVLTDAAALPDVDIVLNAVVGAAGLDATLAALAAGKRVALANKESLVVAGALVLEAARAGKGSVVPIDSEHSAILQCLGNAPSTQVRRLILTASGGPFRTWDAEKLRAATLEDALQHPTWRMGRKITVDSATLANKALEVIEAHFLFGIPYEAIEVVVHPQSIVHSLVEFVDGSVVAQMGVPSMELPILYALTHPDRLDDAGVPRFDPIGSSPLTFEPVRHEAFPALQLGIEAGRTGGAAPAVFNAANEQAVSLVLDGRIALGGIPGAIGAALEALGGMPGTTRDQLMAADAAARNLVRTHCRC
ncbi:MAG: 1-deoxy-D-xylulose-5-phosphate reductoisomerase [Gemmatimonadaceae bacterium]|nr:1-deoxy-D-xylulose-5-phosphate reductoisomerase [Gemmatimonadaceae bacterium]